METQSPNNVPSSERGKVLVPTLIVLSALLASAGAYWFLVRPRMATQAHEDEISPAKPPEVALAEAKRAAASVQLVLPATAQAFEDISVYARVNGYLRAWRTDIGDKVAAGDVMAEIDSPEVDQGLNQAKAKLHQAEQGVTQAEAKFGVVKASLALAQTTAARWKDLGAAHAVSQQEVDEKNGRLAEQRASLQAAQADILSQKAALEAAKAEVARFDDLKDFETVRAPFAGTVSARTVDVGQLINEGRTGKELFRLTQGDTLRVQVRVPQVFVRSIEAGIPAEFIVREFPGQVFAGKVARTSGVVDPVSRTLLTEIHIPNKDGKLLVGMYGQIRFQLKLAHQPILIPSNAVMNGAQGPRVVAVDGANAAHWRKVQVGRDFGASIEILEGLKEGEQVVSTPNDGLAEGATVAPIAAEPQVRKD